MEEETTSSLRVRDVGALATLESLTRTVRRRRYGGTPVDYSGRITLNGEQCGM
jgi:hypothetical protein